MLPWNACHWPALDEANHTRLALIFKDRGSRLPGIRDSLPLHAPPRFYLRTVHRIEEEEKGRDDKTRREGTGRRGSREQHRHQR